MTDEASQLSVDEALQLADQLYAPGERAATRGYLLTLKAAAGGDGTVSMRHAGDLLDAREQAEAASARTRANADRKGWRRLIRRDPGYFTPQPDATPRVRLLPGGALAPLDDHAEVEAAKQAAAARSREAAREAEAASRAVTAAERAAYREASEQRFASELPPHLRP